MGEEEGGRGSGLRGGKFTSKIKFVIWVAK
jgi:hypothetical protein